MDFILTPFGRRYFLNAAMNPRSGESEDLVIQLYQNDFTPTVGDDDSTIVESSFPGYLAVIVADGSWADAVMDGDLAVSDAPEVPVFTCTGGPGQLAYGVFMSETAGGLILGAGRFEAPLNMVAGAVITLDPFQGVLPLV